MALTFICGLILSWNFKKFWTFFIFRILVKFKIFKFSSMQFQLCNKLTKLTDKPKF